MVRRSKSTQHVKHIRIRNDFRSRSLHGTTQTNQSSNSIRAKVTRIYPLSQHKIVSKNTNENHKDESQYSKTSFTNTRTDRDSIETELTTVQLTDEASTNAQSLYTTWSRTNRKNKYEKRNKTNSFDSPSSEINVQTVEGKLNDSKISIQENQWTTTTTISESIVRSAQYHKNTKNASSRQTRSFSSMIDDNSKQTSDKTEKNKRRIRRRGMGYGCCRCTPLCLTVSTFSTLLILAAIAALIIGLMSINKITSATVETTTVTWTTATTTTSVTSTTMTTTTTSSTCSDTCLTQSWLDPSGGIALWPFDGNYVDIISGYNGYASSHLPSFVTGYFGQAASFNVSGPQAIFTPYIPLKNVSFTIEAWIKPTGYPNPSDFSIIGLCPAQITDRCLHINIRNTKLYFGFFFNDCPGSTTILLNQWIHTAFVFDVNLLRQTIYLNGVIDGQSTVTSALLVNPANVTIGTNEGVSIPNNYFQGYIDQLSINQRAKSACEVLEIATLAAQFTFDAPAPSNDSGPNAVVSTSSSISFITAGQENGAISFAGTAASYFQASGFTAFGINDHPFSITFWIQPQQLAGTIVHLSSSASGTGTDCFSLLGFSTSGAIVAQVLTSTNTLVSVTGPVLSAPTSTWINVVQTWSATNGLRLYVNNTLVGSASAGSFLTNGTTTNYLTLGNCLSGCGTCLTGLVSPEGPYLGGIDDWRIYIRELTANDVCTLNAYT